jgi:predicted dehydrogenase
MTGYMMRYMATFKKAREILKTDVIGTPITFNAQMYVSQLFKEGKGWRYDKNKSGGGVINTQSIHAIDLISWYFDFPDYLNASLLSPHSKHTEDFGHITFNWDNGLMGWLDASWSVYNHRLLETTVNDDTIKLYLNSSAKDYNKGWNILRRPELETGVAIDIGGPQFTRQDQHFVDAVENEFFVESDVYNAYKVQKIVDAVYASGTNQGHLETIGYNE